MMFTTGEGPKSLYDGVTDNNGSIRENIVVIATVAVKMRSSTRCRKTQPLSTVSSPPLGLYRRLSRRFRGVAATCDPITRKFTAITADSPLFPSPCSPKSFCVIYDDSDAAHTKHIEQFSAR